MLRSRAISVALLALLGVGAYSAADRILWVNTGAPIVAYNGELVRISGVDCTDWIETKAISADPEHVRWRCGMFLPIHSGTIARSALPRVDSL